MEVLQLSPPPPPFPLPPLVLPFSHVLLVLVFTFPRHLPLTSVCVQEFGAKVIGVVEYNGSVFNSAGLDVEALKEHQV